MKAVVRLQKFTNWAQLFNANEIISYREVKFSNPLYAKTLPVFVRKMGRDFAVQKYLHSWFYMFKLCKRQNFSAGGLVWSFR